jgi:signal transduction histidine kinase
LVVIAIPLTALLVSLLFLRLSQSHAEEEQNAADRTVAVRDQIRTVETQLLNAETGVRGSELSGNDAFLDPYHAAFDRLPAALASLERLVGEDPGQQARATNIRFLAGQKLETLAALRADVGSPAQRDELLARDNQLMDELRAELAAMQSVEEQRLHDRVADLENVRRDQGLAVALAALLGLAGGVAATVLFTTGVARRVERLAVNASRLAAGRPLLDRPSGRDEVGHLAQAIGDAAELLADREQKLLEAKEQAERANWAKSDFLSRTSHELRTPLTAIKGFSQVLLSQSPTEKQADLLRRVVRGADHVSELLEDVLDLARIESGSLPMDPKPVPIGEAVASSLELISPLAEERDVTVLVELGDVARTRVRADPRRLRQVLINLLSNAVKYNRNQGIAHITGDRDGERAWINVTDQGKGIAPDKVDRLFVPYDRLGVEDRDIRGIGLGLTITKSLVELMGGTISVESKLGEGSTFTVSLPRFVTAVGSESLRADAAG